jgi:hypothetical protein
MVYLTGPAARYTHNCLQHTLYVWNHENISPKRSYCLGYLGTATILELLRSFEAEQHHEECPHAHVCTCT